MEEFAYKRIASNFAEKYQRFFQGNHMDNEVTSACSQVFHLQRNRMKRLGIDFDVKLTETGIRYPGAPNEFQTIEHIRGLQNTTTIVHTPIRTQRTYTYQGKTIAKKVDWHAKSICSILEGTETDTNKYNIISYHVSHDDMSASVASLKFKLFIVFVCIVLSVIVMSMNHIRSLLSDTLLISVALSHLMFVLGGVIAANAIVFLIATLWAYRRKTPRLHVSKAMSQLSTYYKDFHFEKFANCLEDKLKTIHYAEDKKEISSFVRCDLSDEIALYHNVVDCEMKSCKITSYQQDLNSHYIKAEATTILTYFNGKRFIKKEEPLQLSFHKLKQTGEQCAPASTSEEYDWLLDMYCTSKPHSYNLISYYTGLAMIAMTVVLLPGAMKDFRIISSAISQTVEDIHASGYIFQNEMIPSLEYYDNQFDTSNSYFSDDSLFFEYNCSDSYEKIMMNYPQYLVEENGFFITESTDNKVVLQREKQFSSGMVYLSITKEDNEMYCLTIAPYNLKTQEDNIYNVLNSF